MKNVKVFFTQTFRTFSMALAIPFMLMSCSSETENNPADQAQPIAQALTQPAAQTAASQMPASQQKYEIVPNEKVCMVNDKFMGIKQIPIDVEGITYYGCCQNCVKKLQENLQGVRYGKDPISKEKVDKASAVTVRNLQDNTVTYFASQAAANEFMKK